MKHLLILISILLLSSPVIGDNHTLPVRGEKGETLTHPHLNPSSFFSCDWSVQTSWRCSLTKTVIGNVSNSRKQILFKTLDDELSHYFGVSPLTNVSSGKINR